MTRATIPFARQATTDAIGPSTALSGAAMLASDVRVFGLTGGIGSGKSTVAKLFREHGVPVVDADVLARKAVAKGTAGLSAVVELFGNEVLEPDGSLNRAELGARVFGNPTALAALNQIVHPEVRRLAQEEFQALARSGEPLTCYEVPLLFEGALEASLRPVVVVRCSEENQISRTKARDGLDEESIRKRMSAQLALPVKAARADFVIDNDGTREDLEARALAVLSEVVKSLGLAPARYRL